MIIIWNGMDVVFKILISIMMMIIMVIANMIIMMMIIMVITNMIIMMMIRDMRAE